MLELDRDDCMSSGGGSIHLSSANGPVLLAIVHLLLNSLVTVYGMLAKPLHIHAKLFVLAHLEATLRSLRGVH